MNRTLAILIAALLLASAGWRIDKGVWVIGSGSQLIIQGYTNVNTFTCKVEYSTGTDTLRYAEHDASRELRFTRSKMTIPVQRFDCGAKPISRDFWRTLKSDRYQNLEIKFISLENLTAKENIKGVVDITIAGSTARYTICYKAVVKPNGNVLLTGMHDVNFVDFGLVAPKKLNGLITVKEGLKVEFHLLLEEV